MKNQSKDNSTKAMTTVIFAFFIMMISSFHQTYAGRSIDTPNSAVVILSGNSTVMDIERAIKNEIKGSLPKGYGFTKKGINIKKESIKIRSQAVKAQKASKFKIKIKITIKFSKPIELSVEFS